jgi:serine/threonine-protein kinase
MVSSAKLSDRYVLEDRLASGGMGAVYAATDERLSRRVAVKLLREELAEQPRFVERFRREAQAVAALSHPSIANVYDYGEDDSHYYIVMELLGGRDLSRILPEEAPLDPQRAGDIAAQTCDALAAAHAAGVVHRDVKPGNIMVDDNDRVKVTDFGIARAAGQSTLTGTGSVIGTAQYLSPEQASGARVGPQSDLYSLGIVLYEMLTGAVPFTGDTPIGVAMRHVAEEVPPPSSVNPDVPAALDDVVAKATAKEPSDRFASAGAMASALRSSSTPTSAAAFVGAGVAAAAGTAVLEPSTGEAARGRLGAVGAGSWDRQRIGRAVAVVFGALGLVLLLVLLVRLASGEPASDRSERAGGRTTNEGVEQPAAGGEQDSSPDAFIVPETIIGEPYGEVEELLEAEGFDVDRGDEIASAEEEDTVLGSVPAPGNPVEPGGVITLTVSSGEPATEDDSDEDDSEDDDDDSDPGHSDDAGKPEKPDKPPKPPKDDGEEEDD